jgi:hypothetical protein
MLNPDALTTPAEQAQVRAAAAGALRQPALKTAT